jgi:hypothetical protein
MSGSPKQQSLEKDWVFSDVNLESLRSPSPDCLNKIWGDTVLSQRCRTTSAHRMTCDIGLEEEFHSANEERAGES